LCVAIGGGECRMGYGQVNPLNLTSRPGVEDPLDNLILDSPPETILLNSRRKRDTEMVLRPEAITDHEGRRRNVISSVAKIKF
jgi:hypothetical protein